MCHLSLTRETESISFLSRNLDHCNQRCIHQPQNNHQSDVPTGILIHPSVKPTTKKNNEKIVAMWPFSHWAGKLSPSPRMAPLSRNLVHCNQCCIHQPKASINQISQQGYSFTFLRSRLPKQTMKRLLLCGPFLRSLNRETEPISSLGSSESQPGPL